MRKGLSFHYFYAHGCLCAFSFSGVLFQNKKRCLQVVKSACRHEFFDLNLSMR